MGKVVSYSKSKSFVAAAAIALTALVVIAIFVSIPLSHSAANAGGYEISPDVNEWVNSAGYDLGGYQISIAYRSYTKNISGVYHGFTVTLDKTFLAQSGTVDKGVFYYCSLFSYLEEVFTFSGYTVTVDAINGQFDAWLEFDSMTDYYIASGIDGYQVDKSSAEKKSSFLYTDYHSQTTTVFTIIEEEGNLLNEILNACYKVGAERDKILLTYVYGTPYKMINTDADEKSYSSAEKLYLHSFNMTMGETGRVINLYQHVPNSVGWYVLAVIIALPFIAVPLIYMILKKKKARNSV